MKRRRLIALISLCTLIVLGIAAGVVGMVVMRTDVARKFVEGRLRSAVNGSVHLGAIRGNPFGGLSIDTLAIRDTSGAIVLSLGRTSVQYDIRDLLDMRLLLRNVVAEHPVLHLRQYEDGTWNYKKLMKGGGGPRRKGPARTWGDFVVLDSVRAVNATFFLSLPWRPDTSLRGARRDSAIRYELARKDRRIERTPDGNFARTYMWTRATGLVSRARLVDPDSNRFGQEIRIAKLDVDEFDPPFRFRNVAGVIRRLGDSLWLDLPHFDLPGSTGSAVGKVVWGSDLPMRYDILVRGDSVSLRDVKWVYATLPETGGGSMVVRISNTRNVRQMDVHIDSMDVRSTGSRLRGEMTFGIGGPVLQIRNVNLDADPIDFDLIRVLNGKPFPIDWRGQIFGDIRAAGGPLTDFEIGQARGEWRDGHVRGAVSQFSGRGSLDIRQPALTAFQGFDVNIGSLDLRSIQFLFPEFPKLNGTIAGRARLDSVWTDVRFSNADIVHRDGPGTPSRFVGSGRITDGDPYITYDLDLIAQPLSFDMLARSFPVIKLRGLATGPIRIRGTTPSLDIAANLTHPAGQVMFAGNIDIDSIGGYGARGRGSVTGLDLAEVLTRPDVSRTSITGVVDTVDLRGATVGSLSGLATIRVDSSVVDSVRFLTPTMATIRFQDGRAILPESVVVASSFGRIVARGGIGLPGNLQPGDSVSITLDLSPSGALAPFFIRRAVAGGDTTTGRLFLNGYALGRLDSLSIVGDIDGRDVVFGAVQATTVTGRFSIADALRSPNGVITARLDSVAAGGLRFDTVGTRIDIADTANGAFRLHGAGRHPASPVLAANGGWNITGAQTAARLDSFSLAMPNALWTLDRPATLTVNPQMFSIDSVGLRDALGGSIGLSGTVPVSGPVDLRVSASRVPLIDLDRVIGQIGAPLGGFADFTARVNGTRDQPVITALTEMDSIAIGSVGIGRLSATASYAANRANVAMSIFQGPKQVLRATADSLPLRVSFFEYDTLPGRVRLNAVADSAQFSLMQAFVDGISDVSGALYGSLTLDGTWSRPNMRATSRVVDGRMRIDTLGILMSRMSGSVLFTNDTLEIGGRAGDSLRAQSGAPGHTAALGGKVAFNKWTPYWLDLSASLNNFQVYNRAELATIHARTDSGNVRLNGRFTPSSPDTLSGIINVDVGAIYLPDPKQVGKTFSQQVGVSDDARRDSTDLFELITRNLQTDLRVHLGGDFRLSADYADIPLSGDLRIVPVTVGANGRYDLLSRIAPEGTINADRGTYTWDLFPLNRTFTVEPGGTISFDRDREWNGLLDITARYTVRPFGRPEVPVLLDVTGRLLSPTVSPRSAAAYPISQSDLISYLVFGEPGFNLFGDNRQTVSAIQGAGLQFATSFASEHLRRSALGRWAQLRVQTANLEGGSGNDEAATNIFYRTRLAGERALGKNVFISVSAGLCGFDQQYRRGELAGFERAYDQLGAALDYRLTSTLTTGAALKLSTEPSTTAMLCSPSFTGVRGTAPTPRQYSFSWLKFWRW